MSVDVTAAILAAQILDGESGGGGDVSGKADKVTGATSGNLAGLDSSGNLTDSGKNATDFATATAMTAVQGVIPETATVQNKLATASDITGEDIANTAIASPLTDSADARVQGLTIKGRSHRSKNLFNINGNVNMIGARHIGGDEGWIEIDDNTRNTVSGNVLTANRNESTSWGGGQIINVKPNTNYTISAKVLSFGTGNKAVLSLETQTQNLAGRLFFSELNERLSRTYNSGNNSELLFAFYSKDGTGAQFTDIQIEESAAVTDYEPYGIHSVGDDGLTVTLSKTGETSRTLSLTTGLPLRSVDANTSDELDAAAGIVTKRCYYDSADDEVKPLVTPTVTPLTSSEISAFRALRTFDGTTDIGITDDPEFVIGYLKNTDNGRALAAIQDDAQAQIDDKITTSALLTLNAAGWNNNAQTVSFAHDTSRRNVIDVTPTDISAWGAAGVYASAETSSGITFTCSSVPASALTFRVTSMEVSN